VLRPGSDVSISPNSIALALFLCDPPPLPPTCKVEALSLSPPPSKCNIVEVRGRSAKIQEFCFCRIRISVGGAETEFLERAEFLSELFQEGGEWGYEVGGWGCEGRLCMGIKEIG